MNTEHEFPKLPPLPVPPNKSDDNVTPSKLDESAAHLAEQLQNLADERKEERFYWILLSVILLDGIIAPDMGVVFVPVFLLQLILLSGLAIKLGVDFIAVNLMRLLERYLPSDGKESSNSSQKNSEKKPGETET